MGRRGSKRSIGSWGGIKEDKCQVFQGRSTEDMKWKKKVRGSRQTYDSVSNPYGREGIYPLTAASRPDEV